MNTSDIMQAIIDDLARTLTQVEPAQIDQLQTRISNTNRVFLAGKGRTGLQMRAFAMRLMHLGLTVHVIDEVTTPALTSDDLLIIGSGSGRTASLIRYAEKAKDIGASLITITGNPDSPIASLADTLVHIPATNPKSDNHQSNQSILVMGARFEHTLGLVCDLIIIQLKDQLDLTEDEMFQRHANLE